MECESRFSGRCSRPHSVKQWELSGTDYKTPSGDGLQNADGSRMRFSAWTPVKNTSSNQHLFQERTTLIFHWFDMWTDNQRKHFIQTLLKRCSKSQRKFTRDWLMEAVPIKHVDFTSVLPRCLSLYIFNFLNPMELCKATEVSWHWKSIAEEDCLWLDKCTRRGWFLPYTPSSREVGAWKAHYVSCASSLDYLTPREAAEVYGTMNETLDGDVEEKRERLREHMIRRAIRERGAELKKDSVKSRRAWLRSSWSAGTHSKGGHAHQMATGMGITASLVTLGEKWRSMLSLQDEEDAVLSPKTSTMVQTSRTSSASCHSLSSSVRAHMKLTGVSSCPGPPCVRLVLISSRVPAYELLLAAARVPVELWVYDHRSATLDSLITETERLTQGRRLQSVGLITNGGTEDIHIIQGVQVSEATLLKPKVREFWEKMSGLIMPQREGGSLDIFLPLAASESGVRLVRKLSSLTGLDIRVPSGICTGSYQHVLSEWCGPGEFPPLVYFHEAALLTWCWQAEWLEEALGDLRLHLQPHIQQLTKETQGRMLGHFLCDRMNLPDDLIKSEVTEALTEALMALSTERIEKPLEFLAEYLLKSCDGRGGTETGKVSLAHMGVLSPLIEVAQGPACEASRRLALVRELQRSEGRYVLHLRSMSTEYYTPLRAALDSNRAVLSSANILMVFAPVLDILEVNSVFLKEVTERLKEWGPQQCVGDVCQKLATKLWVYTNFFNNYPTILKTIDKCKGALPVFRSFLKRHDRTPNTYMLSLQELLLAPYYRIEEYTTLLQSLCVNTPPEHQDHALMTMALHTMLSYRSFLLKLKRSSDGDVHLQDTQRMIQSCPNLKEPGRYLIITQDVALLKCLNENICTSLRMFEHVQDLGLFLFNDALLLSERKESHQPYSRTVRTSHTFLASVALRCLILQDIPDTRYVQNAFMLKGPKRQWICASERGDDKMTWLSALKSAIAAASSEP
ncbi:epithelial cell-transforming sequence 2 oncogene-like [Engraulis encrasicolus]|uniref:epithelial cell-transforming sequence 2 oncogene-like n=1 Tax=Engraulis encrasicolus TaxID=184585 RepID=UPI002FD61307